MPLRLAALLLFVAALAAGCAPERAVPPLATFPVTGRVLSRDGQPVTAGLIEFVPLAQPGRTANGEIQPDGSFALKTIHDDGQAFPGALAGSYRALVVPPMSASQSEAPLEPRQTFVVEERDNQFDVTVDPPPK